MKVRNGFVSNSSSSSFIVVFEKKPKTKEELKKLLFGNRREYHSPYNIEEVWSTDEVIEIVWCDLQSNKKSMSMEKIIEGLLSGYPCLDKLHEIDTCMASLMFGIDQREIEEKLGGRPNYSKYITADFQKNRDLYEKQEKEYDRVCKEWAKKCAEQYFKDHLKNKCFIAKFSYADEDGSFGSAMEHGDLFKETKFYMRVSQH